MRLFYLIAAHNEQMVVPRLTERIESLSKRFTDLQVYLLDNGSTDNTWVEFKKLEAEWPKLVRALHTDKAGLGVAFRMGLEAIASMSLSRSDWIVLAAADFPFGLSDAEAMATLQMASPQEDVLVYVGSKAHKDSVVARNIKRSVGSAIFYALRRVILGLKIGDTQGSIFLRGDSAESLRHFRADNYFFAVELLERAQRLGTVKEIPITLEPDSRPSRVRLVGDGWRMLKQLIRYRFSRF